MCCDQKFKVYHDNYYQHRWTFILILFFLDFKLIIKDGIGHNLFSLYNTLVLPHIVLLTVEAYFVSLFQLGSPGKTKLRLK